MYSSAKRENSNRITRTLNPSQTPTPEHRYGNDAPKQIHALKDWIETAHHEGNIERRTSQQWAHQARLVFTEDEEKELGLLTPVLSEHRGSIALKKSSSAVKLDLSQDLITPTTPAVPTLLDDKDLKKDDVPPPSFSDMTPPTSPPHKIAQKIVVKTTTNNDDDDEKQPEESIPIPPPPSFSQITPPSSPPHKNDASNSKEIKDRFAALLRATYASSGNLDDRFLDSKTKLTMQRYDGYEDILVQRLGRHMYKDVKEFEELKDFVMNTMTKSDLWIRRQSQPWANRARKKIEEQAEKEMKESKPETLRKRSKLFKLVTAVYDAGGENKDDVEVVKEIEQSEETELVKSLSDKFEENAPRR